MDDKQIVTELAKDQKRIVALARQREEFLENEPDNLTAEQNRKFKEVEKNVYRKIFRLNKK